MSNLINVIRASGGNPDVLIYLMVAVSLVSVGLGILEPDNLLIFVGVAVILFATVCMLGYIEPVYKRRKLGDVK